MSARDYLLVLLSPEIGEAQAMKLLDDFIVTASVGRMSRDKHRAEVLREAAEVAVRAARACGDSEMGQCAASVAAGVAKELRTMAARSGGAAGDQQPELRGRARLDAKTAADGEATHWRRLGITPESLWSCGECRAINNFEVCMVCRAPRPVRKGGAR